MIKNIIFDFGCVLINWSQHNLYDTYFGSKEKTDWFIDNICTWEWNNQTDVGKTFASSVEEKIAEAKEYNETLIATKDNLDSKEYIETICREKLNMYSKNEKVYININK